MKRMLGYAAVAVVGVYALRLAMGLVGMVFSLLSSLIWFGLMCAGIYIVIRIVNPAFAERIRDIVSRETGSHQDADVEVEVEVDEGEAEVVKED